MWRKIAARNEAHIRSCQGLIANLTPFRGPSADAGTIFEVGFARALGLKLFGYTTVRTLFLARTLAFLGDRATAGLDGAWVDGDGLLVEDFGLLDNLMIEGGIEGAGGTVTMGDVPGWTDLSVFEYCVANAARQLVGG